MATLTRIVGLLVLLVCFCTLSSAQQKSWLDNAFHERDAQRGFYIPVGLGLAHYIPPVFVPTTSFQGNILVSGTVAFGGTSTLPRSINFTFTGTPTAARTVTFPDASITVARSDAAQTFTGAQSFSGDILPTTAAAGSIGSSILPFHFINFSGTSASPTTNNFNLTGASTGGQRVIIFQDASYTVAGTNRAQTFSSLQTFGAGVTLSTGQTLTLANSQTVVEGLLSTTAAVDMNTATATLLYTCPAAKTCVISKVVLRNASTSLTTVSVAFGWTSASFNDVIATATHTELTGSTLATILIPKVGAKVDPGSGTFKVLDTILQGGAATVTIDVYGSVF